MSCSVFFAITFYDYFVCLIATVTNMNYLSKELILLAFSKKIYNQKLKHIIFRSSSSK